MSALRTLTMAIPQGKKAGRASTFRGSSSKANAAGYAKRQSRSVNAASGLADVYDFQHGKTKRANVTLSLDREEAAGHGPDDEEDDEETERLRPRLIGENGEDERIGSDEDEDIDSDAAFEESDEERYAGFDFRNNVCLCQDLYATCLTDPTFII